MAGKAGMLKLRVACLAVTSSLCLAYCFSAMASDKSKPIQLRVSVTESNGSTSALEIRLKFPGDSDGESEIVLPSKWGGQVGLHRALRDIRVSGGNAIRGIDESRIVVRHKPHARLSLSYHVVDMAELSPLQGADYRVRVGPDFFYALGDALVARPTHMLGTEQAEFEFRSSSPTPFASDLEHARFGRKLIVDDLFESVLLGGNIRVFESSGGARLALHGSIDLRDDKAWRDSFNALVRAERNYWAVGDEPFLAAVWTQKPEKPGVSSIGGVGRSEGCDVERFRQLVLRETDSLKESCLNRVGGTDAGLENPSIVSRIFRRGATASHERIMEALAQTDIESACRELRCNLAESKPIIRDWLRSIATKTSERTTG